MYNEKVLEYSKKNDNVGSLDRTSSKVGTGFSGNAGCGDVMRLQIEVDDHAIIHQAKYKAFGCGSAMASSALATEWLIGKNLAEASEIKNRTIAEALALPPIKYHCSILAETAIKNAISDLKKKQVETMTATLEPNA